MKHRVFLTALLFCCACVISGFGKDLEIAIIHLDRYRDSGILPKTGDNQSVSIANRSDKMIDLYDYSITNNGKEILRIKEHVKLEKDSKKEFFLSKGNTVKEATKSPAIDSWFEHSTGEKDIQGEKESLQSMIKRYQPYLTKEGSDYYAHILNNQKIPFVFSEIALISPQNEIVDQILVTASEIQKNPYSTVAFLNPQKFVYTSVFRKGDYIIVSTIPKMKPFQIGSSETYIKGEKRFDLSSWFVSFGILPFHVPDQEMNLFLYRDEALKEEIIHLEGQDFSFTDLSIKQENAIEEFFNGSEDKKVYYKLFVKHPVFPELSLSEPITGTFDFHLFNWSQKRPSSKWNP